MDVFNITKKEEGFIIETLEEIQEHINYNNNNFDFSLTKLENSLYLLCRFLGKERVFRFLDNNIRNKDIIKEKVKNNNKNYNSLVWYFELI